MITVNELRVGNWIKRAWDQPAFMVDTVTFSMVKQHPDWYEGVALSAEVLERAGFEIDADESKHQCWHFRLGYNEWDQDFFLQLTDPNDEIDMCITYSRDTPESSCQIINFPKYLHQLQNLYFALTGEELPIEL